MSKLFTYNDKPVVTTLVNNQELRFISTEDESNLDSLCFDAEKAIIDSYLTRIDVDSDWETFKDLSTKLKTSVSETELILHFTNEEKNYLSKVIHKDLEYGVDNMFFFLKLADTLKEFDDSKAHSLSLTYSDIMYIYTVLSGHKEKGVSHRLLSFASIITKIIDIVKLVDYYNARIQNISDDIAEWAQVCNQPLETKSERLEKLILFHQRLEKASATTETKQTTEV
jgi:uncharacterized protein YciW